MKPICRYKEFGSDELKSVFDNISNTEPQYKETVLRYLRSYKPTSISPQIPIDLFSDNRIEIDFYCSNDGEYYWRSDMIYYFEKYNLKLNDDFIDYVLRKNKVSVC